MRKGLVAIILIFAFALAACSGNSASSKDNSGSKQPEQSKQPVQSKQPDSMEFTVGNSKVQLETKKVLSDKAEILLPKQFAIMSDEMAKVKYPSANRPTLIYTNDKGSVNVAFNLTANEITSDDLPKILVQMKQVFGGTYPDAKWYKNAVEKINNKNVGVLEFVASAADTKVYNLIYFSELNGKLLLTSFNCTEQQMEDWKPVAKKIMDSLKTI